MEVDVHTRVVPIPIPVSEPLWCECLPVPPTFTPEWFRYRYQWWNHWGVTRLPRPSDSLDHGAALVLQAALELLKDLPTLLQLGGAPVGEGQVVHPKALPAVGLQQGGHPVHVQLAAGAEHEHVLHALVLQLVWAPRERGREGGRESDMIAMETDRHQNKHHACCLKRKLNCCVSMY